ncbi:dienelactone hydrolase family protein [Roseinatronobacter bogoriensis]|uniref:Dienelactone hydrolase n=1 Tax=Roseinatronobacter bogoriensis subsp. barguzinensis TaxID=441209 RepID=A0A2K8K9B0_9RHOB|nr:MULTISPECIES: dienelactone hydrolase family protein [Rhodobaca]ATX66034.1 dienelactone hydrolase [Rhodobaca barguzinensis]MBB4207967.1 dienelactone hydrolase [Rhodobaca bogoriensis DSM 18756]TDW38606.1 dienelactone hydrolase [Rhodobaca barguzinensis]TDY69355.1 dienelactone hydrolase [Rhodobaca bogoriensis DSM 18756]
MKMSHATFLATCTFLVAAPAMAENFEYTVGETVFEGYVAMPEGEARGTVLIVHDWDGLNDHEIARADAMAEAGFVGVALDLFGRDAVLDGIDDYRRETGALYGDRDEFRARIAAGAEAAGALENVPDQMVLTGYCFGGAAALEGARAGFDMAGFVSFHGGLGAPEGQDYSATQGPVLVLHGSADPVSGMADLAALMDELREAGVAHESRIFGGARHSFTVEGSNDWDPDANAKAEAALLEFLDEVL